MVVTQSILAPMFDRFAPLAGAHAEFVHLRFRRSEPAGKTTVRPGPRVIDAGLSRMHAVRRPRRMHECSRMAGAIALHESVAA